MGKSFKPNPDTSAVTTAAAETGVLLSAFDKSPSAEYFAIITHSLDRHRLRIFNVRSGTVSNDFSSEKKERFTCLTWGDIPDDADLGQVSLVYCKPPGKMYNVWSPGQWCQWKQKEKDSDDDQSGCTWHAEWHDRDLFNRSWQHYETSGQCAYHASNRLCAQPVRHEGLFGFWRQLYCGMGHWRRKGDLVSFLVLCNMWDDAEFQVLFAKANGRPSRKMFGGSS